MPVFDLKLKAELENVESITTSEETIWRLKIRCMNCGEVSPSFIEVSSTEEVEVPGTRGVCNCSFSCKLSAFVQMNLCIAVRERCRLM